MAPEKCRQHHRLRTECRPIDKHVESVRVSDTLWDALKRTAADAGTYPNEAIEQAVDAWLALPDGPLAGVREKGLGPGKPHGFRVTVAQWDQLTERAAEIGVKPHACVNAAILAYALPDFAGALRNAAEIAATASATPKPAATERKPRAVRTERPAPVSVPVPAPRDERAPVVAELRDRIKQMETVPAGTAIFQAPGAQRVIKGIAPDETPEPARKKRTCKHPNMKMVKGVCPDCHEWVTKP